jgi:lysine 6-dehydrogenase
MGLKKSYLNMNSDPMKTNTPPYTYLILGAGRQGTAAAYDLALHGEAGKIIMADADLKVAQQASQRVNQLNGRELAVGLKLDVTDQIALKEAMKNAQVALSAVPYYFNLAISRAAIDTRTHLTDMGGNTAVVWEQLALNDQANQASVSIVPDAGMGPGLINTMGAYAIGLLDEPQEVIIYDAGLPQNPRPPWNYALTFHINGLTNEMDGQAVFLRNGQITLVDTLSEPEFIEFPGLGLLEADVTSGGTSTAPWTFQGKLQRYENKVLRYPGHFEWLRAYKTLGLFSEQPVQIDGKTIIPRSVYHALLEPKISAEEIRDVAIIRAEATGIKDGRKTIIKIDLMDYFDEKTGFTAMERLTGWHCSILMTFLARAEIPPGVIPVELALAPDRFMQEFDRRGISHKLHWS